MVAKKKENKDKKRTYKKRVTPALFFLPTKSINRNILEEVKKKLKESKTKRLYLVIKSYGGDTYSAVRIIKHIYTKYEQVIGVVPEYTYSAAALMLLGTKKIFMAPEGYIAPIDKPMEHPRTGETISALDVTQSVANLAVLVKQNAVRYYESMRGSKKESPEFPEGISKTAALKIAWKSSVELARPLVKQIDPVLLQKCYRDLRIGLYYGIDLLSDYMLPTKPALCFDIANKLVNIFPSHGYAIFREETKRMGLIVDKLEDCKDVDKLLELYKNIDTGIEFAEDIYA